MCVAYIQQRGPQLNWLRNIFLSLQGVKQFPLSYYWETVINDKHSLNTSL